jgi:hypothetical protein
MAKRNNVPGIISGIALTVLAIALGWLLLPSFWFWIIVEISAALLVAVGCSGEWWLHHHPAGRKKKEKDEYHHLEAKFIAVVAIGVITELFTLTHAIREGITLERKVSRVNERAAIAERAASEAKERTAIVESNNLALRSKVMELEAKNRWRTISTEQKDAFTNITKSVLKIPIRVRMSSRANAEAQSFAKVIRDVLDLAGFAETNKEMALAHWPPEMDILWSGAGMEMPPIVFLNHIDPIGKPADLRNAQIKLKSYAGYSTNSTVRTEFIMENRAGDPEAFITEENGIPVLHLRFPDPAPFQMAAFNSVQSAFAAIGVQSAWITDTNIPSGVCEIFINPR